MNVGDITKMWFKSKSCKYCYHKKLVDSPLCECPCHEEELQGRAMGLIMRGELPNE